MRSIPALAGEPMAYPEVSLLQKVYPRACGGTEVFDNPAALIHGLSPRLRGNQEYPSIAGPSPGSIPALAGEPVADFYSCPRIAVYPRACGGTFEGVGDRGSDRGLSPRLRGNRRHGLAHHCTYGSIPALAGEPLIRRHGVALRRVYPRACGGTRMPDVILLAAKGLSPRLRGNRRFSADRPLWGRSIPALAGEP